MNHDLTLHIGHPERKAMPNLFLSLLITIKVRNNGKKEKN